MNTLSVLFELNTILIVVGSALFTFFGSLVVLRFAKNIGLVARVESRSSHVEAKAVGGGIPIFILVLVTCLVIEFRTGISNNFAIAYIPAGLAIALTALADDIYQIRASIRLVVYSVVSVWALVWIGPVAHFTFPGHTVDFGLAAFPLTFLFVLWMTNLFNFMDGIDGLVPLLTSLVGCVLWALQPVSTVGILFLVMAVGCLGFLRLNFPRAKMFLGDVGSTFIGFSIAILLIQNADHKDWVAAGLVLLSPLTVDATMTLFMRILLRKNIFEAHKEHLYQRLTQLLQSHTKVTGIYVLFTLFVLLPLALICSEWRNPSSWILHLTYGSLCLLWLGTYKFVSIKLSAKTKESS